jgi:hypothetical protein
MPSTLGKAISIEQVTRPALGFVEASTAPSRGRDRDPVDADVEMSESAQSPGECQLAQSGSSGVATGF